MSCRNLYIHVPFCHRKCDYCAFYSLAGCKGEQVEQWLDKILDQYRQKVAPDVPETVFVGGGTPTWLDEKSLERLGLALSTLDECTMESNPETLTPAKMAILKNTITRISIGVQSFDERHRQTLGRHTGDDDIRQAVQLAAASGLRFNIDLIYGIPGQTPEEWRDDLQRAIDCGVDHVSCYSLTVEEGTALAARLKQEHIVSDEMSADMWHMAGDILGAAGLRRYEISNYARPGMECRHNLNIWRGDTYLGLGPVASSFDGTNRWMEPPSLSDWLKGKSPEMDIIEPDMRRNEIFAFGLRTVDGWTPAHWPNWDGITDDLRALELPADLLVISPERIHLTTKGLLLWDSIAELCLNM